MPRSSFDFNRGVTQWRMEPITGSPRTGLWAFTLGYDGEVPCYEDIAYGDYFQTSQTIDTTNVTLIRCHVNITQPKTLPDFEDVSTDLQFIAESGSSPGNRVVISRGVSEPDVNRTLKVSGATHGANNGELKLVGIADSLTAYVNKTVITEGPNPSITASLLGARWKFSLLIDNVEYARCIQSERETGFYRNDLMLHCSKLTGNHTISFRITLIEHDPINVYGFFPEPPTDGLVFWVKGDTGLESTAGVATAWRDQSGLGQDITDLTLNPGPFVGLDTVDGIPCVTWPLTTTLHGLFRPVGMRDRNGTLFGYDTGEHQARTITAVVMPRYAAAVFGITGGLVAEMGSSPAFQAIFDLEDTFAANAFYAWSTGWRDIGSPGALRAPNTTGGSGGTYDGVPLVVSWWSTGFDDIHFSINGVEQTLTPSVMYGAPGPTVNPIFSLGRQSSGGFNFFGIMSEFLMWDFVLTPSDITQLHRYLSTRYPSITL